MLVKCKECKKEVSHKAKVCPHCGVKDPGFGFLQGLVGLAIIVGVIYLFMGGDEDDVSKASPEPKAKVAEQQASKTPEWWEGGEKLLEANALAWQKASARDKMASCAQFIARIIDLDMASESFRDKVTNTAGWKAQSLSCTADLNTAFEPESDPQANINMYTNQDVLSTATILASMKGWLKKS